LADALGIAEARVVLAEVRLLVKAGRQIGGLALRQRKRQWFLGQFLASHRGYLAYRFRNECRWLA